MSVDIIALYVEGLPLKEISALSGISQRTIGKRARKVGLAYRKVGTLKQEIISLRRRGVDALEIRAALGCHRTTVQRVIRECGL